MHKGASAITVIEIGTSLSSAFAGLILAQQDAQVLQVQDGLQRDLDEFEQAYFDRLRTPIAAGDASKQCEVSRLIITDLSSEELARLQVPHEESALGEGQILVRITPFGITPSRRFVTSDIIEWAAGGLAYATRRPLSDGDKQDPDSPVLAPARQPEMLGGLVGATAAFFGIFSRQGGGSPLVLDISRQEVQAAMLHGIIPPFVWNGVVFASPEARTANVGMLVPANDGQVYLRTVEPHQWESLVEWMGRPSWTREDWITDPMQRHANGEKVKKLVGEWSYGFQQQQLLEEGQRRGVPISLPRRLDQVLASHHLQERDAWISVDTPEGTGRVPRVPLVESRSSDSVQLDEKPPAQEPQTDLKEIRVLDMGWSWAGPYAGMILADLGADVIKLESSRRIDILRWSGAFADEVRDYERSGYYGACNRGKKSFVMNLQHEEARETVLRLVEKCDVVIENFAPRVMGKLGLDHEALLDRNPRVIQLSMSGYGATGPERNYLSYGDHLIHASGMASITGFPEDADTKIGIFYGDPVGGIYGAMAVLAALNERRVTGKGNRLELSQLEGLMSLIPVEFLKASIGMHGAKGGNRSTRRAPQGFYRCLGKDTWVALAVETDLQWQALRRLLVDASVSIDDYHSLESRQANADIIDTAIGEWTAARSPWDVAKMCQDHGVAAHTVMTAPRLLWDKHLHDRGFFEFVDRPIVGPHLITGPLFRSSENSSRVRGYAPLLGEHNDYVYQHILGMGDEELKQAIATGLVN